MEGNTMDEKLEEQFEKVVQNLNATSVAKSITKFVIRRSVSAVVVTLIHTHIPEEMLNRNRKIQLSLAAWAMGGVISDGASNWAANRVGTYVDFAQQIMHQAKDGPVEPISEPKPEEAPTE